MHDHDFDRALIAAAFQQASFTGWRNLSIVEAAQAAGLPLDRARARFPGPAAVLMRFGLLADQAALSEPAGEARPRDRLFDLLMKRFDFLQMHRDGMLALLDTLPTAPATALALGAATLRSMAWMLEAAGLSAGGVRGMLRAQGLVGVWLYALRAWRTDTSPDLAGTMAALDKALDQAEQLSSMLSGGRTASAAANDPDLDGVVDLPADAPVEVVVLSEPPPPPPETPPESPPI